MTTTQLLPDQMLNAINPNAIALLDNPIVQGMSVIDWGKVMARVNEIIQKDILKALGIEAYDPETDDDCPKIDIANNSPGFDILVRKKDGTLARIQSKLRQVKGVTDFSQQVHFETTRRHSKKNEGIASGSGHVAYGCDEFDYVMVSLVNVGKKGEVRTNRNNIAKWSFALIPVKALINSEKVCCLTHIPSKVLKEYEFNIETPPLF